MTLPIIAGSLSNVIFVVSYLPMLVKAARTRDLSSYSLGSMVLANAGNVIHSLYVFHLPPGPLWALHSFYLVTTGLMLLWYVRYTRRTARSINVEQVGIDSHLALVTLATASLVGGLQTTPAAPPDPVSPSPRRVVRLPSRGCQLRPGRPTSSRAWSGRTATRRASAP